jgi:hypothetical protein
VRAFAATKTACLALGLVFVMRLSATAQVAPPVASDATAVVAADIEQTVLTPDGRATTTTTRLYLAGTKARLEPESGSGRAGYAEFHLYDFERKRFHRVFPDDRIYSTSSCRRRSPCARSSRMGAAAAGGHRAVHPVKG